MRRWMAFSLAALALFLAAAAGAAMDEDFFNTADFFDVTSLHHEHLVVLVVGAGALMVVLAVRAFSVEIRAARGEVSSEIEEKV
ncbi:MAG TPA: hypothetical protein VEL81_05770 [Thermoplasmata archaeon]|nr:hypothetical protein [Thermoplasmata archaeon]